MSNRQDGNEFVKSLIPEIYNYLVYQ